MKKLLLSECYFHDSIIDNISFEQGKLVISFGEERYHHAYSNSEIILSCADDIGECTFTWYRCHFSRNTKEILYDGKIISFEMLQDFFALGGTFLHNEFLYSPDKPHLIQLQCEVEDKPKKKCALYEKYSADYSLIIQLYCYDDFLWIRETSKSLD